MPSRNCRRSLMNNMLSSTQARSESSGVSEICSHRSRSSKRASKPNLEEPPSKQPKAAGSCSLHSYDAESFCFSSKGQATGGKKSFYGGKQSRYLSPMERKRVAELKGHKPAAAYHDTGSERKENVAKEKPQESKVALSRNGNKSNKSTREAPLVDKSQKRSGTRVADSSSPQTESAFSKKFFKKHAVQHKPAPVVAGKTSPLNVMPKRLSDGNTKEESAGVGTPRSRASKVLPSHTVSNLAVLAEAIGRNINNNNSIVHTAESPVKIPCESPRKAARQPFINPFSQDLFTDVASESEVSGTPEFWRITINGKSSPQLRSQSRRNHSSDSGLCQSPLVKSTSSTSDTESVLLLSSETPRSSPQKSRESTPLLFDSEIHSETETSEKSKVSESSIPGSSESLSPRSPKTPSAKKLAMYPIFTKGATGMSPPSPTSRSLSRKNSPEVFSSRRRSIRLHKQHKNDLEQLTIDAGQRLIGAVQCQQCGMTYTHADPTDEATHRKFHERLFNVLKFPGWKKERMVQEFLDGGRIVLILPEDKFAAKKVEAVKQMIDEDLGFVVESQPVKANSKIYMFISADRRIIGCCIAQVISTGYRVFSDSQDAWRSQSGSAPDSVRPWCCSTKPEPARCGISRIWVPSGERRCGVASKLIDCVRGTFFMGCPLKKSELAFSDPTPDGKVFATKYTGTPNFLVYKHISR